MIERGNGTGKRKSTLALSDAVLQKARLKRIAQPLVLKGVGSGKFTMLSVEQHSLLNIDERYQRIKIPHEINELVFALRSGGIIPDPITIARRKDGSLWVIDGQERMWAYFQCNTPIPAMIHDVDSFENERVFYCVMNRHVRPNADSKVQSWSGPGAELLRSVAARVGSPLYNRVNFGRGGSRTCTFGAAILAKACVTMLYCNVPSAASGEIENVLGRLDAAMNHGATERMTQFFRLLAEIFPPNGKMKFLIGMGMGKIAGQRWSALPLVYPPPKVTAALRRVNWDNFVPSFSVKYLPTVTAKIERHWPASAARSSAGRGAVELSASRDRVGTIHG